MKKYLVKVNDEKVAKELNKMGRVTYHAHTDEIFFFETEKTVEEILEIDGVVKVTENRTFKLEV